MNRNHVVAIGVASALAGLVPGGSGVQRVAEARRVVSIGAVAAAILVVGAGVGPFVPRFFGARISERIPAVDGSRPATVRRSYLLAACVVTIVLWFGFGPGIRLS